MANSKSTAKRRRKRYETYEEFQENFAERADELYLVPDHEPDAEGTFEADVLLMYDTIILPKMVGPLFLESDFQQSVIDKADAENSTVIGLSLKDIEVEEPGPENYYNIGVELAVSPLAILSDGSFSCLTQARNRLEILDFDFRGDNLRAKVRVITENQKLNASEKALMRIVHKEFERWVELSQTVPDEAYLFAKDLKDPGWLADLVCSTINPSYEDRGEMLTETGPNRRLLLAHKFLSESLELLELEEDIHSKVQTEVDKSQREFYLREQIKAIQSELGEGDIFSRDLTDLRERVERAKLPEEARKVALKEIERLVQLPPMAPEVGIIRTYIEWILDVPWINETVDHLDVKKAAKLLDRDHYGLDKAKDRIIEYIAVRSLKPKKERQPILCFVGAPGTGKTSIGKSIAEALGREFVRVSLGGVHDEAEIRGHRRTYIGALPGRVLQTMKRAGTVNPLFMLDEIDKLGSDFRGDPSSALLEVLDPEQNNSFSDHYLEIPYDLSKVMFITTANNLATIPEALLDRMEVIEFPGYIEEEKAEISFKYLIPRQLEENGMENESITFAPEAVAKVIREYTYEAGVRNLEREIGKVVRKLARSKAEKKVVPTLVTPEIVEKHLGPAQFFRTEAELKDEVGVSTSLAWTENGGEIMAIEVAILEGKGNLQMTGQIGDVMQESGQAALTYIRSRCDEFRLDPEIFEQMDIHVHIPEGGIPKDGPSAGITLACAILSALTGRPVFREVGMTGEITLRGRVLPIGGLREKVLAAHRAGLKFVILPKKNLKDLIDVPQKAKDEIKLIPVEHMDEVIKIALYPEQVQKPPRPKKKPTTKEDGE